MDIFNQKYITHLESELERERKRTDALELQIREMVDAKMFSRIPERLVRKTEDAPAAATPAEPKREVSAMTDALSVAEAEAWELSKPRGE